MLRENGNRICEKNTHYYIDNHLFSFFWIGDVKPICTYFKKSTYILQIKNHEHLSGLYVGETEGL